MPDKRYFAVYKINFCCVQTMFNSAQTLLCHLQTLFDVYKYKVMGNGKKRGPQKGVAGALEPIILKAWSPGA